MNSTFNDKFFNDLKAGLDGGRLLDLEGLRLAVTYGQMMARRREREAKAETLARALARELEETQEALRALAERTKASEDARRKAILEVESLKAANGDLCGIVQDQARELDACEDTIADMRKEADSLAGRLNSAIATIAAMQTARAVEIVEAGPWPPPKWSAW
jgi:chromosome segregation ATPase